jgi:xylan 1,4-beta-xylosidase
LLQDILRDTWNFTADYNYVVSDCNAVTDIWQFHNFTETEEAAASVALNAGTDLECGASYLKLNASLADGQVTESRMDQALTRLYNALFTVGFFDGSEYQSLGWSDVATPDAQQLAYQAAVEGLTLLKNENSFLPLSGSKKVAVIGPYGNATTQMQGDYSGTAQEIISPLAAFQGYSAWDVTYAMGTAINTNSTAGFANATAAAAASDLVIFLGGLDNSLEQETLDRTVLSWPGNQYDLIAELAKTKPVIVIQFGGGQVDDTPLLTNAGVKSVIWAGYPSQSGGTAILDVLTGKQSIAGRLPITQYPASYNDEVSIYDIALQANATYPGRTYRWYTGTAVRPFGYGEHYTTFSFAWKQTLKKSYNIQQLVDSCRSGPPAGWSHGGGSGGWGGPWGRHGPPGGGWSGHGGSGASSAPINDITPFTNVSITVRNTGKHASDYVALLFLSSPDAGPAPQPVKTLVSYSRAHDIPVHGSQVLNLPLTLGSLARADTNGDLTIFPGKYELALDNQKSLTYEFELTGKALVIETLPAPKSTYSETVPVRIQGESYANYGQPL